VIRFLPSPSSSAAAPAAMRAKMPVVIGHQMVALCLRARASRRELIVVTFPFGTFRISSSTSLGAGITIVPVPHILFIPSGIFSTRGRSSLSASFSRQLFRVFIFISPFFLSFLLSVQRIQDLHPSLRELQFRKPELSIQPMGIPGQKTPEPEPLKIGMGHHDRHQPFS